MTDAQLSVARAHAPEWARHLGYDNMRFLHGRIEALGDAGVKDCSMDLVISNCVVNLSPDKRAVLSEVFRVLADGGEFYFSDVYADRRLPQAAREDPALVGECLGVRDVARGVTWHALCAFAQECPVCSLRCCALRRYRILLTWHRARCTLRTSSASAHKRHNPHTKTRTHTRTHA